MSRYCSRLYHQATLCQLYLTEKGCMIVCIKGSWTKKLQITSPITYGHTFPNERNAILLQLPEYYDILLKVYLEVTQQNKKNSNKLQNLKLFCAKSDSDHHTSVKPSFILTRLKNK